MQTLDNLYGTHTSFYMRVNFAGLTKLVDALGGVDVYSTKTFSMGGYNFTEGVNHLNGEAACASPGNGTPSPTATTSGAKTRWP